MDLFIYFIVSMRMETYQCVWLAPREFRTFTVSKGKQRFDPDKTAFYRLQDSVLPATKQRFDRDKTMLSEGEDTTLSPTQQLNN